MASRLLTATVQRAASLIAATNPKHHFRFSAIPALHTYYCTLQTLKPTSDIRKTTSDVGKIISDIVQTSSDLISCLSICLNFKCLPKALPLMQTTEIQTFRFTSCFLQNFETVLIFPSVDLRCIFEAGSFF